MKAETNSLTFAAQGKPRLPPHKWIRQVKIESCPLLDPPDHQSGPNRSNREGDRDREVLRASDGRGGGGVEVGGSRKGTGGGDPSSITSNSGAKSEKRDVPRATRQKLFIGSEFQVG